MADEQGRTFEDVHERLSEIVDAVSGENISLDDALKLYEEAVKLGLSACDLSEQDIDAFLATEEEAPADAEIDSAATADAGADPAATADAGIDPVGGDLGRPSATNADVSSAEEGGASTAPTDSTGTASPADAPAPGEA